MPAFLASESPIAMACFGLVTFLPLRPDLSRPFFIAFISVSTFFPAEGEYLLVVDFFWEVFFAPVLFLAVLLFFALVFFALPDLFFAAFFVAILFSSKFRCMAQLAQLSRLFEFGV